MSVYLQVDRHLAKRLRRQADRIRCRITKQTVGMLETGRDLQAAKSALTHGQFTDWVESECGISPRLARHYMQAAHWFDGAEERKPVSALDPTVVIEIAKQSTPQTLQQFVIEQARNGARVQTKTIRQMICAARREAAPQLREKEWDTAREVALAKAAVRRREKKADKVADDEYALVDFYAAWGAVPEHMRAEALREIGADTYLFAEAA